MEYDLCWDNEVVADNDEHIAALEAEITEAKALLAKMSRDDELF